MHETDCRICHAEGIMSARGLCACCEALAEIARKNLEGAKRSTLPRPTERPPCETCEFPQEPVLFRPEGPWTFYCVKGCYGCPKCSKVYRFDQTCPHDRRSHRPAATDRVQ